MIPFFLLNTAIFGLSGLEFCQKMRICILNLVMSKTHFCLNLKYLHLKCVSWKQIKMSRCIDGWSFIDKVSKFLEYSCLGYFITSSVSLDLLQLPANISSRKSPFALEGLLRDPLYFVKKLYSRFCSLNHFSQCKHHKIHFYVMILCKTWVTLL